MKADLTLYGYAVFGRELRGIADRRVRAESATRTLRRRWLSVSWPATRRGAQAAADWSLAANVASAQRRALK
jgi:hypothetical protein